MPRKLLTFVGYSLNIVEYAQQQPPLRNDDQVESGAIQVATKHVQPKRDPRKVAHCQIQRDKRQIHRAGGDGEKYYWKRSEKSESFETIEINSVQRREPKYAKIHQNTA